MKVSLLIIALVANTIAAFPLVADMPGVDSSLFRNRHKRQQNTPAGQAGGAATCPFNSNHVPAPGITDQFPYNGATNGLPGKGVGGYKVPADGDTAHQFVAPGVNDIRGPCPGLNAAANHNFLAHDGIVTFNELVDAQQNVYNLGYDVAVGLALLAIALTDGDVVTEKLSIGCDATSRTSFAQLLTGEEMGLDGHNHFEADTSLTRNDYFLADGDNFSFNGTLFKMMTETTGGLYDRSGLAKYRYQRYQQSRQDNPNFYFGPLALVLYGAASFLYEVMPSGPEYIPDEATISSFFGAEKQANGSYTFNNREKIPDNWYNRVSPYTLTDVITEILASYSEYPVLFGGATGNGGFDFIDFKSIKNGTLVAAPGPETVCSLYQLATQSIPYSLDSVMTLTVTALTFVLAKLQITLENLGCSIPLTK